MERLERRDCPGVVGRARVSSRSDYFRQRQSTRAGLQRARWSAACGEGGMAWHTRRRSQHERRVRGDRAGVAAQRAVRQVGVEELADRARQPRHRRRRRAERRQRQRELRERRVLDADRRGPSHTPAHRVYQTQSRQPPPLTLPCGRRSPCPAAAAHPALWPSRRASANKVQREVRFLGTESEEEEL